MDNEPSAPLSQISTAATLERPPPSYKILKPSYVTPLIYSRDFAYANNRPRVVLPARMAKTDISNASASSFAELLSGPLVDIYVGPSKKHWSLHQNLLAYHSSYCELEFGSHEVLPKINPKLELMHDDPKGFELLVKWLYQGCLEDSSSFGSDEEKYAHAVACHKLWLLCDRFDMIKLKNLAMDQYRRCLNESHLVPDADEIDDIYRTSPANSPFRQLMVKIAARQIMDPETERDAESYRKCLESNPDFAIEMIKSIRQMSNGILFNDPTRGDACSYHDHADMSGCPMLSKGKPRTPKTTSEGQPEGNGQRPRSSPLSQMEPSKRTPRKLRTPFKTPSAAFNSYPTHHANSESHEPDAVRLRTRTSVSGSCPSDDGHPAPHKPSSTSTETLQLRMPTRNVGTTKPINATSSLPRETTQKEQPHNTGTDSQVRSQAWPPETPPRKAKIAQSNSTGEIELAIGFEQPQQNKNEGKDMYVTAASSRKRKLADRTPRKLREKQPTTVLIAKGESARTDSAMSGPRKLRVSSIVQRLNESSSEEMSRVKDKVRRRPAKLGESAASVEVAYVNQFS